MIWTDPPPTVLTSTERALSAWVVTGDELQPNDVLIFLGQTYRIDRLPEGHNRVAPEPGTRVIWTGGREFTWASPSQHYRILPRPAVPG